EDHENPEKSFDKEWDVETLRNTPGVGIEGFQSLIKKAIEAGDYNIPREKMGFNPLPDRNEVTINITRVQHIDGTDPDDLSRGEVESQLQMLESTRFLRKYVP